MYQQGLYPILIKKELNPGFFDLRLDVSSAEHRPQPGQFAHILCGEKVLRRPISICDYQPDTGMLRLVFEVRGEGTLWLSQRQAGEALDVLFPIGHGFELGSSEQKTVVIGGGIGVPPLLYAARHYEKNTDAILGFRNESACILVDDFRQTTDQTLVSTDDGSVGHHGLVTDLLAKRLKEKPCDLILACGPLPMLKGIAALAQQHDVACQVSLEERMGCGIGACLGCACRTKTPQGETYTHVCKNGPVYRAEEVVW